MNDFHFFDFPTESHAYFFTARVRSTREGTVFTGVFLSTSGGGGLPTFWAGGGGGGVPTFPGPGGGVPTFWVGGGTYFSGLGGGWPTLVGGYLPWQGEGVPT